MKIIFFADAHLDRRHYRRAQSVEAFVRDICEDADMVVVLGDLFEFYHGHDGYIYPWYRNVIDGFKHITAKGKTVYFIEGNHEFDMGSFFESYTGIKCVKNLIINIEGKKTFISHGHEIKKLCLENALKSRVIYALMNLFGPEFTWKIAMVVRVFLSKKKRHYNKKIQNAFRKYAQRRLDEGYNVVILAHSHISDRVEFNTDSNKIYLNTGDFIKYLTYIEYNSESGFEIKKYKFEA
jgi:UDP-2,3-diacylglucosamine hydrolase